MKKAAIVALTLVMLLGIGLGSALAANSLKSGSIGLNFDVNNDFMLTGKYFIMNDLAVLAGFGFGVKGGDAEGTDIAMLVGARKYLKVDDFAPFVGGGLAYRSTQDSTVKEMALIAEAGAEYFLGKQLSIEGSIGFGYSSTENSPVGGPDTKDTNIGTQKAGLSINLYF